MHNFRRLKSDDKQAPEQTTFLESKLTKKSNRFQGWRFGVLTCTVSTCVILVVNVSLAIWALSRHGWGRNGQPILHEGKCDTVSKLNTGIHLLINSMSTVLLCTSSYCMQCLSAPTRTELDHAHSKQSWLDIGVLSPRNLKALPKSRRIRWFILGLSTVPLHLFYNSIVFASFGTNLYYPFLVKESFLELDSPIESNFVERDVFGYSFSPNSDIVPSKNPSWTPSLNGSQRATRIGEAQRLKDMHANGGLERLENRDCLNAYATQFQSRGSLLLVTKNETHKYHLVSIFNGPWATQDWICASGCCEGSSDPIQNLENWSFSTLSTQYEFDYQIAYCLSEPQPERCRLQFSLPLAIIVVFFNVAKALCMFSMIYRLDEKVDESPIMNIGDIVSSYLQRSDAYTKNMCLVTLDDLRRAKWVYHKWDTRRKEYKGKRRMRFRAASRTRWAFCFILYVTVLTFIAWLLKNGIETASTKDGPTAYTLIKSLGFGKVDVRTTVHIRLTDLITNAVIANAPQVVLSWVYFSYNGLLTLMSLAREWESYTLHRKGLRVSGVQEGEQRSTYFLQLPYRIAIPFTVLSAFLHWLVSQSFFLVSVQLYGHNAVDGWQFLPDSPTTRVSCGYSLLPLVVILATGGSLLVAIIARGLLPLKTATPVVGSCSAAIAAACQPLGEDDGESVKSKVQWGVMGRFKNGFEHCGMSRRAVRPLVAERLYR